MDPAKRTLLRVVLLTEDRAGTADSVERLMGTKAEARFASFPTRRNSPAGLYWTVGGDGNSTAAAAGFAPKARLDLGPARFLGFFRWIVFGRCVSPVTAFQPNRLSS